MGSLVCKIRAGRSALRPPLDTLWGRSGARRAHDQNSHGARCGMIHAQGNVYAVGPRPSKTLCGYRHERPTPADQGHLPSAAGCGPCLPSGVGRSGARHTSLSLAPSHVLNARGCTISAGPSTRDLAQGRRNTATIGRR